MSGGKQTTTQSTQSSPWGPSQSYLTGAMGRAQGLLDSGVGAQVSPVSTAIPFDPRSQRGLNYSEIWADRQMQNVPGTLVNHHSNVIAMGGKTGDQARAMDAMYAGMENLQPFASGENMGEQNPLFRESMQNAMQDARDQIDMTMSGAGRYGSGSHSGVLSDRLGRIATDAYASQFERDRNAMLAANQMQQGIAGDLFNAGQTSIGNVGAAFDGMMAPMDRMRKIGAAYENLEANRRQDQINRFDRQQMAPWENLARANAIFGGTGALGGTSSGTATAPGQNPFATALGYGAGGAGLLGAFM